MEIRMILIFWICLAVSLNIEAQVAYNAGSYRCVRPCEVTDEDYSRGWIDACQMIETTIKRQQLCYFNIQQWRYECIYYERPESRIKYSCCPSFTLQFSWCVLPPRPPPSTTPPPLRNELPSAVRSCGRSKYANSGRRLTYIVGGYTSLQHEFPWVASVRLGTDSGTGHLCGASILSSKIIVTAAHCATYFKAFPNSPRYVVIGDFDRRNIDTNQATYDILDVIFHPNYDPNTVNNDIAILRLESSIVFNEDIQPVCLPEYGNNYTGRETLVIGWGSQQYGGATSQLLQFARLSVMTNTACNERLRSHGLTVTSQMLCASDGNTLRERDSCQGDSGGPLVVQESDGSYTLIGLVSWGLGCAVGTPGVYTRITQFTSWIQNYL